MRVVSKPRLSESEKPVEKTGEEGEEVSGMRTAGGLFGVNTEYRLLLWG